MKILHYALGFPPYRTGGLTKYCTDLMQAQKEQCHEVALLWPGQIKLLKKSIKVCKRKQWHGIDSYEIINPLPVPLDEGIVDVDIYTGKANLDIYIDFLNKYAPDAIHIHTLMGLHREFLEAANELNIRTIFTSHDYFGLCPKVTLFHAGKMCDDDHNCEDCVRCNLSALSINKIMLMQSPLYRRLKDSLIIKKIREKHRQDFFLKPQQEIVLSTNYGNTSEDYRRLRKYYVSMLQRMDCIHFNSKVSENVYCRYVKPKNRIVIPITHNDIEDHRRIKDFDHEDMHFTYLGPAKPFKGFGLLIDALDYLWNEMGVHSFELHLYSEVPLSRPYIKYRQSRYTYDQLEKIFDETDLLVAPSLWYETFGYTVLEALSYGVPVLVSENVGAKDIIAGGITVCRAEQSDLAKKILGFCEDHLSLIEMNKRIIEADFSPYIQSFHAIKILELYK